MHPCCWPAMIQSFLSAIPFLAIFAVAGKKAWDLLPKKAKPVSSQTPSCCSSKTSCSEPAEKQTQIKVTTIN